MLKYVNTDVVFQEIPNETTLAINISNCPCHCKGCHSSYLAEDIGEPLTERALEKLIRENKGITCISFMGGDSNPEEINNLAQHIPYCYGGEELLIAWYSGKQELPNSIDIKNFDFIKLGPYVEELGGLKSPTTNQRLYKVERSETKYDNEYPIYKLVDITYKFWK